MKEIENRGQFIKDAINNNNVIGKVHEGTYENGAFIIKYLYYDYIVFEIQSHNEIGWKETKYNILNLMDL